jgi:hypothetical protein
MGADWYYPQTWYGYSFLIPSKTSYASFMALVNPLCDFLPAPYSIVGILESFHSRMEMDVQGMDDMAIVILAFPPSKDLTQTTVWAKELAEYVQDSPVLLGLDLAPEPRFFTGIEWEPTEEAEEESSSSSSASTSEDPLAQSIESLASVESVESSPSTSASFFTDQDDTLNYHGEYAEEHDNHLESDVEAEAEADAEAEAEADNL